MLLAWCNYIVIKPVFIWSLQNEVHTGPHAKCSLYLVISQPQGIDVLSPRSPAPIVGSSSRTCPSLGPSRRFYSKVNLARVSIWTVAKLCTVKNYCDSAHLSHTSSHPELSRLQGQSEGPGISYSLQEIPRVGFLFQDFILHHNIYIYVISQRQCATQNPQIAHLIQVLYLLILKILQQGSVGEASRTICSQCRFLLPNRHHPGKQDFLPGNLKVDSDVELKN